MPTIPTLSSAEMAAVDAPTIALDLPSGLDPDHGTAAGEAIRAAITLTLALPKTGLVAAAAAEHVGRLALGDIAIPPQWTAAAVPRIQAGDWYAEGDLSWLLPNGPSGGPARSPRPR